MKFDAIIFDKDGTLLDFDALWVPVTEEAIRTAARILEVKDPPVDRILEDLGIRNGITAIDGTVCKGTYTQIGKIVWEHFFQVGCTASCAAVSEAVVTAYNGAIHKGRIKPACPDLAQTMQRLADRGIKLFVVTTDNRSITDACLEKLGIFSFFTDVFTDDGRMPTKPDPACAEYIMSTYGIARENILMVGDTETDAHFAENAGISVIGVAKDEENARKLGVFMDKVLPDVSYLPDLLK